MIEPQHCHGDCAPPRDRSHTAWRLGLRTNTLPKAERPHPEPGFLNGGLEIVPPS
jgi:hypothetical protein